MLYKPAGLLLIPCQQVLKCNCRWQLQKSLNILLKESPDDEVGTAKIADFGMAKVVASSRTDLHSVAGANLTIMLRASATCTALSLKPSA